MIELHTLKTQFFLSSLKGYINYKKVEKRAGIPEGTFRRHYQYMRGKGGEFFPTEHMVPMMTVLCKITGGLSYGLDRFFLMKGEMMKLETK